MAGPAALAVRSALTLFCLVAAGVAVAPSGAALAQPSAFADVAENTYYAVAVASLAERGVFAGTE